MTRNKEDLSGKCTTSRESLGLQVYDIHSLQLVVEVSNLSKKLCSLEIEHKVGSRLTRISVKCSEQKTSYYIVELFRCSSKEKSVFSVLG